MIKAIYRMIGYTLLSIVILAVLTLADAYIYKGPDLSNIDLKTSWIVQEIGASQKIALPASVKLLSQDDLERASVGWIFEINPIVAEKALFRIQADRIIFHKAICGFYNSKEQVVRISSYCGEDDEALLHELTHHVFYVIFGTAQITNEEDLAREIARRYIIQKRWSLRFLYKMGLFGLISGRAGGA